MIGSFSNKAHSRVRPLCVLFAMLLIQAASVSVFAQDKPKAGDLIQGVVTDSVSPLMAVYIRELDSADRAVAYAYTDLKGEFSFRLVNPKDRIQFSYYRKEKIVLPIDKANFEIRMEDDKDLPPIDWDEFVSLDSRDVRDAAKSPVLIDVSEFEDLGLYTIDEILNAKMGLDLPWFDDTDIIHGYVDLGLSVKWATCNVGADKPEDYGDYYAWGELTPKESYTWENYRFRTSGDDEGTVKLSKYTSLYYTSMLDEDNSFFIADDKTQLDLEDDVAHVKWGGDWRLPTNEEMNELIDSCTWTWTTLNGVNGCLVTSNRPGYTDRSIFLPATGKYGFETSNKSAGTWGHYWSNSVNKDQSSYNAGVLAIGSGYAAVKITFRAHGQSVRPVCP